jgi:hypothetical protein
MNIQTALTTAPAATRSGFLRGVLKLDAAVTGANALAYLAAFALLDGLLGVAAAVLVPTGAFLLVYAALVGRLAAKPAMPRAGVVAVIAANVIWAVDSLIVLATGMFEPTLAGQIWIALQAIVVLAFAAAQLYGLRRG